MNFLVSFKLALVMKVSWLKGGIQSIDKLDSKNNFTIDRFVSCVIWLHDQDKR